MRLEADYHTHTIYSHGKGTIEDNVKVALEKGLKEIAITDHGPGHYLYGVKKRNLPIMREEIDNLNEKYQKKGIRILLGVEANLISLDGHIDMDDELLSYTDLLIMGYHYGAWPRSFKDGYGIYIKSQVSKLTGLGENSSIKENTLAFIRAINKYPIKFLTHPGSKARVNIRDLAKEAAKVGTGLEINSRHSQLSVESIRLAMKEDVDFFINSDAHSPQAVGEVEVAIKRAQEAGLSADRIINIKE